MAEKKDKNIMKKEQKNIIFGIIIGVIIISIIFIIILQIQNKQRQEDIQRELQKIQEEKEFCDSLKISIGDGSIPYGYPAGVNYAFCSNKDTNAKSVVTLTNGLKKEKDETLQEGNCMLQQIQSWAGYEGHGYQNGINCEDIESIELISDRCPQVKDIVVNMNEVTCGL